MVRIWALTWIAVVLLQTRIVLGQSSSIYPPVGGGGASFNLTPYCRAGSAGTLTFNGGSTADISPDTASVSLTISGNGTTAAEARDLAAEQASSVVNSLLALNGIDEEDLTTSYVSVQPQTNYNSVTGKAEPAGFSFDNSLTVQVNNVTNNLLSQVLDTVVRAGGDNASIDSVSLSLSPQLEHDITNQVRRAAVADAKATARLYSEELGVILSGILAFTDNTVTYAQSSDSSPSNAYIASAAATTSEKSATPTSVALGTQSVSVSVNVVYSICTPIAS